MRRLPAAGHRSAWMETDSFSHGCTHSPPPRPLPLLAPQHIHSSQAERQPVRGLSSVACLNSPIQEGYARDSLNRLRFPKAQWQFLKNRRWLVRNCEWLLPEYLAAVLVGGTRGEAPGARAIRGFILLPGFLPTGCPRRWSQTLRFVAGPCDPKAGKLRLESECPLRGYDLTRRS